MYSIPEVTLETGAVVRGLSIRLAESPKTVVLSFPTDAQVTDYLEARKYIRNTGRKAPAKNVTSRRAAFELFHTLKFGRATTFNENECLEIMNHLLRCDASCKRVDDHYEVTLKTIFGDVVHILKEPLPRDLESYRRHTLTRAKLPHGLVEMRPRVAPGRDLYDSVIVSISGYSDEYTPATVPVDHKFFAAAALAEELSR